MPSAAAITRALWLMPSGIEPRPGADEILGARAEQRRGDAAAAVVLPMPISPRMSRSAPFFVARSSGAAPGTQREVDLCPRHRRLNGEVACPAARLVRQHTLDVAGRQRAGIDDGERHTELACQHGNRRAPAGEVVQHLHGDVRRIGRDAPRGDPMVAGEQHDGRLLRARAFRRLQ